MKAALRLFMVGVVLALAGCGGGGGAGGGSGASATASAKAITSFSLANTAGTIDEANKTIAVRVPFGSNIAALVASFSTTGISVSVGGTTQFSGLSVNNFTNPVIYSVTASDGTVANYTVMVTVAPSSAKVITRYSLSGWTGLVNEAAKSISVAMPTGTAVTALVATFNTTGASVSVGGNVQVSGTTAMDFTNPVTYTVTAADGSSVNYTVTVALTPPVAIGGTVNGLAAGSSLGLLDNGVDALTVSANGTFNFTQPITYGAAYNVTINTLPAGQPCTLTYGAGNVLRPSIANVNVICGPAFVGAFSYTGSMAIARLNHVLALLPNGKVLVAGGTDNPNTVVPVSSAELYDPVAGTWGATGSMTSVRDYHTATLLPNGKVLVAGGWNGGSALASAELYDPATGTWTATGSMITKRLYHTATLLTNGQVLVTGGQDGPLGNILASAELYDPATGTWTATGGMATKRQLHTATLLPDGKVMVAGGTSGITAASAELYDPVTGAWQATGSLVTARQYHTASLLPNGKVLVVGGRNGGTIVSSAELYDPAAGTWSAAGSMVMPRENHTATLIPNGKVLVAGGFTGNNVTAGYELYDPATGTWGVVGTGVIWAARDGHLGTLLPNGKLLLVGGWGAFSTQLTSAELFW